MKARPATFHIGFDDGGATVSPTTYLDQTITLNTLDQTVSQSKNKKYYSSLGGMSVVGPHGNNGRGVTISPGVTGCLDVLLSMSAAAFIKARA